MQKSSVPDLAPPCECLNTGFDNCMLYPSGFCDCSKSCSFVKDYLQDEDQGNDRTQMVSMRSFSGLMTPINGEGGQFSPSELQNTLEVSKKYMNNETKVNGIHSKIASIVLLRYVIAFKR